MVKSFCINIYFLISKHWHGQVVQKGAVGYHEIGNYLPLQILRSDLLPLFFTISSSTHGLYIVVQISHICYVTWLWFLKGERMKILFATIWKNILTGIGSLNTTS